MTEIYFNRGLIFLLATIILHGDGHDAIAVLSFLNAARWFWNSFAVSQYE